VLKQKERAVPGKIGALIKGEKGESTMGSLPLFGGKYNPVSGG
jgi:hypothetical protein